MATPLAKGERLCGSLLKMPKLTQNQQSDGIKNNQM